MSNTKIFVAKDRKAEKLVPREVGIFADLRNF